MREHKIIFHDDNAAPHQTNVIPDSALIHTKMLKNCLMIGLRTKIINFDVASINWLNHENKFSCSTILLNIHICPILSTILFNIHICPIRDFESSQQNSHIIFRSCGLCVNRNYKIYYCQDSLNSFYVKR